MATGHHHDDHSHPPEMSLLHTIHRALKLYADDTFAIYPETGVSYTYREIIEPAKSVATSLKKMGIGVGDTVCLCSEVVADALIAMVGVWLSGATASPVNIDVKPDELAVIIGLVEPKLIFSGERSLEKVKDAVSILGVNYMMVSPNQPKPLLDFNKLKSSDSSDLDTPKYDPEKHITSILLTSGTTGMPKGIKVRDAAFQRMVKRIALGSKGTILSTSPMSWLSYTIIILKAILEGIKVILSKSGPGVIEVLEIIEKYQPNEFFLGAGLWFDLSNFPRRSLYDISSLKVAFTGGSYVSADVKRKINKDLLDNRLFLKSLYGCTEAGLLTYWPDDIKPSDPEYESVGKLENGVTLKVIDLDTGVSLGPGAEGEICVKSDMLMGGLVKKNFEDIEEIDKHGWFHTGDLGYYDENKYVYFVSRLKDIMKFRGYQIAPSELESVLQKHPDVVECCVMGKPHPGDGDWPTACVVKAKNSTVSDDELCSFVADRVPDFKKLRGGVYFVESIPKSATGKVSRKNLEKLIFG